MDEQDFTRGHARPAHVGVHAAHRPERGRLMSKIERPTRVFLIDDHPVVREALAAEIDESSDLAVVGHVGSAAEALATVGAAQPDVVLVDLNLPDGDGIALFPSIKALVPAVKLVVLTSCEDEFRVAEALRAGAQGYLVKSSKIAELLTAIRSTMSGGAPLSASIAGGVVRAARRRRDRGSVGIDLLTPREREVLGMLLAGMATRQVAERLAISPKTIETHRVRIYAKLRCKNLMDLTRFALRAGMIHV
jgi:two-component system, NarL family, nitrate/nitrite response regulator NarL